MNDASKLMHASKLLSDVELRAHWFRTREKVYIISPDTYVTPSARDFLREHGVKLQVAAQEPAPEPAQKAAPEAAPKAVSGTMSVTPIPRENGKAKYVDLATGAPMTTKPEDMTHLRANLLVPKTHPRILFRGRIDSLMAQIMEVQLIAVEEGVEKAAEELEELLGFVGQILAAEVKEEPLEEVSLLRMDGDQIRDVSHNVKKYIGIPHPIPNYRMGRLCVALNRLRTEVREVELSAAQAFFHDGQDERPDIIEGLNRLSSCVYILFCRAAAGQYGEVK